MTFAKAVALGVLALGYPNAANAIVVDGTYDADYGPVKSVVGYDTSAPNGDFSNPGPNNNVTGYSIYLKEQGGSVYGLLQATTVPGSSFNFANLYFDLDRANNNGSDLGFEVTNNRAFIPGVNGYAEGLGLTFALSADGKGLEFRIPDAFFTAPISGLAYYPGQQFAAPGGEVVLRLSQSFGYSVAGGPTFGNDRLGVIALEASAVPGPIVGAGLPGLVMALGGLLAWRRRRSQAAAG
jgi:hypothetical protein